MIFADANRLQRAYHTARAALLAERTPEGHWVGELSTSALSTAVAVSALALVRRSTTAHGSFDALRFNNSNDGSASEGTIVPRARTSACCAGARRA